MNIRLATKRAFILLRPRSWFEQSPRWHMFISTPMVVAAAIWMALILFLAAVGPLLFEDQANLQNLTLRFYEPFQLDQGLAFILGGDSLGRPLLLQLILGAQTSMTIALFAVGGSSLIGYAIGVVAGYFGGWVDNILLRIADILHTIPSILLALVILFVLEPSVFNVIVVLGITRIPVYLRTARAQTVEIKERTFVEVARSMGASNWRTMTKEIAPLVFPTMRTLAVLEVALVILAASSLTFLGIGLQRPDVDWGLMVSDGKAYLKTAWFVTFFPGMVIVLTALSASMLSNWLRAIEDPAQSIMFLRKPKPEKGSPE